MSKTKTVAGNSKIRQEGSIVFSGIHRKHHHTIPNGGEAFYNLTVLTVPVSFLLEHSEIEVYDASVDDLPLSARQRKHPISKKDRKAAKGHLNVPPLSCNMKDNENWRVILSEDEKPEATNCHIFFRPKPGQKIMRTNDGAGRTNLLADLAANPNEYVEIVLTNTSLLFGHLQTTIFNTKSKPMNKANAALHEAALLEIPGGRELLESGDCAGISKEDAALMLLRANASMVSTAIRKCHEGAALYNMIRAVNDPIEVPYLDRNGISRKRRKGEPAIKRTISTSTIEDMQTGRGGRGSQSKIRVFTPPSWWNEDILSIDEKAMYIQNIARAAFTVWPQAKREWENGNDTFVLTSANGIKATLSFAWKVLTTIQMFGVPDETASHLGYNFWIQMFDMMAPNLPVHHVRLTDENHVEFWDRSAQRWFGGGNSTVIDRAVKEMVEAYDVMGGMIAAIEQATDMPTLKRQSKGGSKDEATVDGHA